MSLKAPGILTFMLSVIIVVCVLMVKVFGAAMPFVSGHEFWILLLANCILILGCMIRAL